MNALFQSIRCFLFDLDGTITLGENLLPGGRELIGYLQERNFPYFYITNNSSRSGMEYAEKLTRLGLPEAPEQIFTSGEATARFLVRRSPGARLFVAGTPALVEEFLRHGFEVVDDDPDIAVLGFDTTLTYAKLWKLCDFVRAGLPYIATHPDVNCPIETGFMPDIGSMMALVEASTGRAPDHIIGKPNPLLLEGLAEKTGLPPESFCMVGDRLYTDIAMGRLGVKTVLVLTGETRREDVVSSPFQPDLVVEDLHELLDKLKFEL